MARDSMADLLTRFRRMIGDTAGAAQVWGDDDLQDAIDVYQVTHRYELMTPSESVAPGGVRTYKDFYSADGVGDWEADEELTDGSYNVLTADTADRINGHWSFDEPLVSLVVRLSGRTYDLNGAAADICRDWAAKVKLEFDFRTRERQYARSQQYRMLTDMADRYDAKRLPQTAIMIRTDIASHGSGPNLLDGYSGAGRLR